jgi:hypothetical protein
MSLIEILAAMFVLVVGIFAVIRILVPGLQTLPRTAAIGKATQSASLVARDAEALTSVRPDVILRGIAIDATTTTGWRVYHDVGMEDVDQVSLSRSTSTALRTLYPNVVCGELFEVPAPLHAYLVKCGPYDPLKRRVYVPDPWTQVNPGSEDDADADINARTFSETAGTITLDASPALIDTIGFVACYTYIDGTTGGYVDLVGEEPAYVPGATTFVLNAPGAIVPLSVTLYEIPAGVIGANADSGRAGSISFDLSGPAPGMKLACMYEMAPHIRAGLDAAMSTRRPFAQDLINNPVPDICSFDTYTPLADTTLQVDVGGAKDTWVGRIVRLPVDAIDLSAPLDALDAAATEPVRIVSRFDGSITVPDTTSALPTRDVNGAYVRVNGLPDGMPIRIYYRVPGNWSIERHMAAANYSVLAQNASTLAWEFDPGCSAGLKQEWFLRTQFTDTDGFVKTLLTYHASPVGTAMDFWDGVTGGQVVFPEADGHRIAVDYRYDAGGGREQRVTGEMHLVDFSTHAIVLEHPDVLTIDAIRGASYKSRVCFDDVDGQRVRVDVDTIVMR